MIASSLITLMNEWAVDHPGNAQYAPSAHRLKAFALASDER